MTRVNPRTMLFGALLIALGPADRAAALPAELEGYDPSGHIRFATLEEAEAHREKLIRYFWPEGLPTEALPRVTADIDFPEDLLIERWMEIYALGAIGQGRRQIQINNLDDTCCFRTDVFESYDDYLSDFVNKIGQGRWAYHSDATHRAHIISDDVRENVILPAIKESGRQAGKVTGKATQ